MSTYTTAISEAKKLLDAGELVAIPTETVYGLAAKGTDENAVKKIYNAKGRPSTNPLILHFGSLAQIRPFVATISNEVVLLAQKFWPGPLTLLLPKSKLVPDCITSGLPRVAVRIPNHPLALSLLKTLDYPLAAPSANPSGYISPTTAAHVKAQLGDKVSLILDGGPCSKGLESTILGWDESGIPIIYRKGIVTAEAIEKVLQKAPRFQTKQTVEAPGMLSSHYAPKTKTLVVDDLDAETAKYPHLKVGTIAFNNTNATSAFKNIVLSPEGSLEIVASKLYAAMHEMDNAAADIILIEKIPDIGIGKAINDRLKRAVTKP